MYECTYVHTERGAFTYDSHPPLLLLLLPFLLLLLFPTTRLAPVGLQAMLELLSSEYAIIQELALRTVDNCMLDTQCRATFRELGGLEKVVEFIGNKVGSTGRCMPSVCMYNMAVPNNCTETVETQCTIIDIYT